MQKIAILYDASQAVLSTFELDEVLQQILIIARDYFHLPNVSILLLDKETNELYVRSQIGWDQKSDSVRVPIGTGLIGTAAKEKRPVYVPDVSKDPRYLPCSKKTASELAIPLMVRDEVVGVLDCQSENVDHFDSETIDLLTLFSTQASMGCRTRVCTRWNAAALRNWRRSMPSRSRLQRCWMRKNCCPRSAC